MFQYFITIGRLKDHPLVQASQSLDKCDTSEPKCIKVLLAAGLRSDPLGELKSSPTLSRSKMGRNGKGERERKRRGKGEGKVRGKEKKKRVEGRGTIERDLPSSFKGEVTPLRQH